MNQSWKYWWWTFAGIIGIGGVFAFWDTAAVAQITPDTSLGTENSVVTPNVDIRGLPADLIEGGATRGVALFHSFSEFNVGEGLRVYFANPVGIETIFSRVTGSDVSNILGTLGVDGGASLFLLNPNGIIFGENARLDIAGSFVGSTANAIGFGEQGIFSATEPETPPLLTINPDALFFNQLVTQGTHSIEVRGSLSVPSGESLLLVGGNVAPDMTATGDLLIDGGTLAALGGRVELAGVGEPGKVELVTDSGSLGLNFPAQLARTDSSIVDSTISVRDADGGDIAIYAQNLSMDNSQILAGIGSGLGSVDAQAGNITINVTETMEVFGGEIQNGVRSQAIGKAGDIRITVSSLYLRDGAGISTSTFGEGDAGQVVIQARDSILFDGEDSQGLDSGVFSQVGEEAKGNSGRIEIETGSLTLTNGGVVSASIFGEGDGGQVVIQARNSILFDGEDNQGFGSGIFSTVGEEAKGNSGRIEIETGSLTFTNGAGITASTFGEGDGGQVVIQARDSILFDGEDSQGIPSGIFSTVREEAKGNSRRIEIETSSLTFTNGGVISTSTFGEGDGGQVVIQARDSIVFDGESRQGFNSGIFSMVGTEAKGNSGTIEIDTDSLTLTNGALINTSTRGKGDAGRVAIRATDSIIFDGESRQGLPSGILSVVISKEAKGNSLGVEIETGSLTLTNGARINTFTGGEGDAGRVLIRATDRILFDGESRQEFGSGIFSTVLPEAKGNSLGVEIETGSLTLTNGARINTFTGGEGDAGRVAIRATDRILFDGESRQGLPSGILSVVISKEAKGNSLGVEINTGSLTLTNGGVINASTVGEGDAGRVAIRATDSILLDGENSQGVPSSIASLVGLEAKGNSLGIEIDTDSLTLTNGTQINASTGGEGDAGRVAIRATNSILIDGEDSQGLNSSISSIVLPEAKGNSLGVEIDTGSLTLTNGGVINASTGGEGDAGRVAIRATDSVLFDGESRQGFSSGIFSAVGLEARGNSLGVEIDTGSLTLTNGAVINTFTSGEGDAGRVAIRATDSILLDGEDSQGSSSGILSGVFSEEANGNSLGVEIETGSLTLTNGARINTSTDGEGNAGRVTIRATDSILFDGEDSQGFGSGIFSTVALEANGNSLGVEIETGSLTLTNGGIINASTVGEGNAGRVAIRATDSIVFDGESSQGIPSGIHSAVFSEAKGNSLGIEIETDSLTLTNGASINAETESTGMAGDVDIHATKFIQLNQGSSIRASATASGQAGNLMVETGHLSVQDGAEVNVSSEVGQAGNLTITADSIVLNHGTISAETAKSDAAGGANISLDDLNLLLLENESLISASALADANGGNVTIDSTFIIALPPTGTEGSDIIANAVQGNGGRVSVTTQGLFDIAFRPQRTPLNDITVSSEFGLEGVFVENRPDIDPNRGLTELANNFIDAERLIDRSCNAGGAALASSFIFTGRGGIPPSPLDVLESDVMVSNWVSLDEENPTQTYPESVTPNSGKPRQIIEAQGWVKLANGQIILVAESPTVTPQVNWQNTTGCEMPESK